MNNRKRVLLIANPASIHIYNYVKNVLVDEGFDITIFNYNGQNVDIREEVGDFYSDNNVKLIEGVKPVSLGRRGYLKYLKKTIEKLKALGSFDICHEHYIKDYIAPAIFKLRHLYGRIVLTYYGSDIYRTNPIRRFFSLPSLYAADRITLISEDMRDYLKSLPSLRKFDKKCTVVDFGNMFYDKIVSLDNNKSLCKISLGLSPDKLLITIGYVGRPQMQQYETLNALLTDKRILNYPVQFAIPAYGMSDGDIQRINNLAHDKGVDCKVFNNFMGEEEVSKLRAGTDIFIHAQTTDALSCAMLEHLFAGSVVVNGSWLRYGTLVNNNVYFKTFDSFSSLSDVLVDVINNIQEESDKSSQNRPIISGISSWNSLKQIWLNQYE